MPTRTIKLIGKCPTPANAIITFGGAEVFNGALNVISGDNEGELCSFDIDRTVHGAISSSITISGGDITVVTLSANYSLAESDAVLAEDGVTVVTPAVTESDANETYHWLADGSDDAKSNVTINGEAYDKGDVSTEQTGAWHVYLDNGDTMTCDWNVFASPGYVPDPA